jgi:hypothetical protein
MIKETNALLSNLITISNNKTRREEEVHTQVVVVIHEDKVCPELHYEKLAKTQQIQIAKAYDAAYCA